MGSLLEVYEKKPDDFMPKAEIAAICIESEGRLLLLKRGLNQPEGGTWCLPAGKLEMGETPIEAAIRELIEETDITLDRSDLESFGKLYIRKSHISYICYLFRAKLKQMPKVQLSFEHTAFQWVTPLEREKLPLILGSKELLALYDHSNR